MKTKVVAIKGKESKIRNFYPTLYADEVKEIAGSYKNGDIVDIVDSEYGFVARGYINENSNALVRVLSTNEEEIDENFPALITVTVIFTSPKTSEVFGN